jgi:hypothetical protein
MGHTGRQEAVGMHREVYNTEKNKLWQQFQTEQKKLEDMVAALLENGAVSNLGTDVGILKQSTITDRLVVDKMKLEEMYARHKLESCAD